MAKNRQAHRRKQTLMRKRRALARRSDPYAGHSSLWVYFSGNWSPAMEKATRGGDHMGGGCCTDGLRDESFFYKTTSAAVRAAQNIAKIPGVKHVYVNDTDGNKVFDIKNKSGLSAGTFKTTKGSTTMAKKPKKNRSKKQIAAQKKAVAASKRARKAAAKAGGAAKKRGSSAKGRKSFHCAKCNRTVGGSPAKHYKRKHGGGGGRKKGSGKKGTAKKGGAKKRSAAQIKAQKKATAASKRARKAARKKGNQKKGGAKKGGGKKSAKKHRAKKGGGVGGGFFGADWGAIAKAEEQRRVNEAMRASMRKGSGPHGTDSDAERRSRHYVSPWG